MLHFIWAAKGGWKEDEGLGAMAAIGMEAEWMMNSAGMDEAASRQSDSLVKGGAFGQWVYENGR